MYERYARFRDALGVTDARVAEATGISKSVMSEWKHGRYQLKLEKLIRIADFFGISLDELVGREYENQRNGCSEETGN